MFMLNQEREEEITPCVMWVFVREPWVSDTSESKPMRLDSPEINKFDFQQVVFVFKIIKKIIIIKCS